MTLHEYLVARCAPKLRCGKIERVIRFGEVAVTRGVKEKKKPHRGSLNSSNCRNTITTICNHYILFNLTSPNILTFVVYVQVKIAVLKRTIKYVLAIRRLKGS